MATNILQVYRGDDKSYTLNFTDSDSAAVDITGYTIYFTVKENRTDTDANAIITKDVTSHSSALGGITIITLSSTDTGQTVKKYYYDISWKDSSNKIRTLLSDTFEIVQDTTTRTS